MVKGEKGCDSGHIDERALYQAFVDVYNLIVENKENSIAKWRERLGSDNALVRYKAKQFMGIMADAEVINEFDIDLYFAFVEKVKIFDGSRMIVSLLDGTNIEIEV